MNEAVKLILACPQCGNSTWFSHDDGFKCAVCEEFCYPEEMCSKTEGGEKHETV